MIVQTLRIPEELERLISQAAEAIGESKQTVIRMAIREGVPVVLAKLTSAGIGKEIRND